MSVEFYEVVPPGYVSIEDAAAYVSRAPRTIYDWIKGDGVRTFKRSNEPALVNIHDVIKVDGIRRQGRRRKPRLRKT